MPVRPFDIKLDRSASIPLARQLYMQMHRQIIHGHLAYKEQLPTTRALAQILQISRGVVVNCYDMLKTDGLICGFGKGGTQVSYRVQAGNITHSTPNTKNFNRALSKRGQQIADARQYNTSEEPSSPLKLTPSVPDFSLFPYKKWHQVSHAALHNAPEWYQRDGGVIQLKKSLQNYLAQYRGIHINDLDRLLITTGTQAALSLLARLLADRGDHVLLDSVGWSGSQAAMEQAGLHTIYAPVDEHGTQLSDWESDKEIVTPKLVVITPSCQFPTGRAMSMERREAFIRYTAENKAWLIEDDYAAEYSYEQHSTPSILAHIADNNTANHVIHIGTMSKLLLPSLRLGWMVVPSHLSSAIKSALNTLSLQPPYMIQLQLAYFIQYGYLSTHLANTRTIYNERRQQCSDYLKQHGEEYFTIEPSISGMNHYLKLKDNKVNTKQLKKALRMQGLGCDIYLQKNGQITEKYLLLGHTNLHESTLKETLDQLLSVCDELLHKQITQEI